MLIDYKLYIHVTFDSSCPYTRIGSVDDPAGPAQALGRKGVRVVFSKKSDLAVKAL